VSNLWREKEDLPEGLSPFASCYFREWYSLEVKGKSVASASHLLDPDPLQTPSGWRCRYAYGVSGWLTICSWRLQRCFPSIFGRL